MCYGDCCQVFVANCTKWSYINAIPGHPATSPTAQTSTASLPPGPLDVWAYTLKGQIQSYVPTWSKLNPICIGYSKTNQMVLQSCSFLTVANNFFFNAPHGCPYGP